MHDDKNKLSLHYSEDEIKHIKNDLYEIEKDIKIKVAESGMLIEQALRLNYYSRVITILSLFTMAVGFAVGAYGYICWYHRIQKYQDMNIRNSLNNNDTKALSQ